MKEEKLNFSTEDNKETNEDLIDKRVLVVGKLKGTKPANNNKAKSTAKKTSKSKNTTKQTNKSAKIGTKNNTKKVSEKSETKKAAAKKDTKKVAPKSENKKTTNNKLAKNNKTTSKTEKETAKTTKNSKKEVSSKPKVKKAVEQVSTLRVDIKSKEFKLLFQNIVIIVLAIALSISLIYIRNIQKENNDNQKLYSSLLKEIEENKATIE